MRKTLAALVLLATPALAADAYYDSDDRDPAPLKYDDRTLVGTISQELGRKKVKSPSAAEVAKLSHVEKVALLYALGGKPGAEVDIVVELDGQFTPVEVHWSDDAITLKPGKPQPSVYGKPSGSKEEIQKKYGIGPFVDEDSKWDDGTLFLVETALAHLSQEELAAIAGLPFHRVSKDKSRKGGIGAVAMYVPEKMQIELYDKSIDADKRLFMGPAEKPVPRTVATLIHECGHAISRKPQRELRTKLTDMKKELDELNAKYTADAKAYNEDRAKYNKTKDAELGKSLQERGAALKQAAADMAEKKKKFDATSAEMVAAETKGSALERALDAKLSFKKSPTLYGRTSVAESFAECLALWKLDRAALERAAPGAVAFFDSEYAALLKAP